MTSKNLPLVSVIVNCHNGQKFLKKCIKSILSQTYKKIEIIFWDNLSTDDSKKIIKSFKDNRIKYFKSKKFLSLYSARNQAVKKAKGEFISFLDTDDWWIPSKIKKQISICKKDKNVKFVYSNCYLFLLPSLSLFKSILTYLNEFNFPFKIKNTGYNILTH